MKKFKILNNLNYTDDDIVKVVNDIHESGYGKLESVLSKTLCEDLANAADDIEKDKLKLIEQKSLFFSIAGSIRSMFMLSPKVRVRNANLK